jgi:general secretion pathway protein C
MQDIVKRYFWLVGVVAIILSAWFASSTVGAIVEAKFLPPAKEAPKIPVIQDDSKPAVAQRSKVGQPIADRNMFCSDCKPATPVATVADNAPPGTVQMTSLHLLLIATSISSNDKESFATILNTDTSSQGGYFVGDEIPAAGTVKEIHYKYVDFENKQNHRVERIGLLGEPPPAAQPPPTVAAATPPQPTDPDDELAQAVAQGVRKIDDNNYEISRGLVDKVLSNPMAVAKGARVVPSVKDGKANGFKLYAIRPGSVYAQIGLANGDTIHAINGFDLTSPDKALEVYTKVKEATSLTVAVTRRGKEQVINYTIK